MSPLIEETPDRAEEYSVPLEKGDARKGRGIYYPRFYSKNPSGGIARSSLSAWACKRPCLPFPVLAMLLFWMSLVQMVDVIIMAFATQIVGANIVRPISFSKSFPK